MIHPAQIATMESIKIYRENPHAKLAQAVRQATEITLPAISVWMDMQKQPPEIHSLVRSVQQARIWQRQKIQPAHLAKMANIKMNKEKPAVKTVQQKELICMKIQAKPHAPVAEPNITGKVQTLQPARIVPEKICS